MNDFWSRAVQAQQLPEQAVRADGEAYRTHMAQASGSRVYSAEYAAARTGGIQPRSIYEPAAPKTLADYQKPSASRWARGNESGEGYLARLRGAGLDRDDNWALLSGEDQAAITAELEKINGAEGQSIEASFQDQRAINDARTSSIAGQQQQGTRVEASQRFGHNREVAREGHLAAAASNLAAVPLASLSDVAAARRAAEEQQMPQRSPEMAAQMGAAR